MTASRRRDAAVTRARILDAAREHFALLGYDRATVRSIAADAAVSANLITRYFGGKQALFDEATEVELGVVDVLAGPPSGLGARIAAHVVCRWEAGPGDDPLMTMLRAAMTDAEVAQRLGDYFARQAHGPVAAHLGTPDAAERAVAMGALITGVVVQRYVIGAGSVARAGPVEFTDWLGVMLQRLLVGGSVPSLHTQDGLSSR